MCDLPTWSLQSDTLTPSWLWTHAFITTTCFVRMLTAHTNINVHCRASVSPLLQALFRNLNTRRKEACQTKYSAKHLYYLYPNKRKINQLAPGTGQNSGLTVRNWKADIWVNYLVQQQAQSLCNAKFALHPITSEMILWYTLGHLFHTAKEACLPGS